MYGNGFKALYGNVLLTMLKKFTENTFLHINVTKIFYNEKSIAKFDVIHVRIQY